MEPKAAPPDDGGDQGAFTRPEDTLVQPNEPERDQPAVAAPKTVTRGRGGLGAWLIVPMLLMLFVMFAYCLGPVSRSTQEADSPATERGE